MYISFEQMPAEAKIWIYQSNKMLEESGKTIFEEKVKDFLTHWEAHQQGLKASFKLLYNRFLVLAVDEAQTQASGCSIDKSVHFLKDMEKEFDITLLDRSEVAFLGEGNQINTVGFLKIKSQIQAGNLRADSIVFDNSLSLLADFEGKWKRPAQETWLARYF